MYHPNPRSFGFDWFLVVDFFIGFFEDVLALTVEYAFWRGNHNVSKQQNVT